MAQRNLGDILINAGVINTQQLQLCQKDIAETGQSLDQCLIEKGFVNDVDIAKALAKYSSLDFIEKVTDKVINVDMLAKIPLRFLRENNIVPIVLDGQIFVLTSNPMNFQPVDDINLLLGGNARPAVSTTKLIIDAINKYYPLEGAKQMIEELEEEGELEGLEFEKMEEKDLLGMATEAPIIKLVNNILLQAAKRGASDIHIEPFEKEVIVRLRIDGIMYNVMTPPKRVQGALASRIKIMAGMNIAEKRIPQDGRIEIKVANKSIDIRVSVLPVSFGERIVMRLLDKSRSFAGIKELGLSERDYKVLERSIERPNGIIYVTGPTGSGKTTTLYSILNKLNQPEVNIITVEDPVEYQMAGIGQVQVREKIGLTFAAALRSILRQDPDIVMIGETRDQETAQIAIQAALTGHLVLSTLHTNSASATITRLIDMGVEPFLIASSIVMVCAQRLVRRLCPVCKATYVPELELIKKLGLTEKDLKSIVFYKPVGCEECNNTGYKGRLAIFEIMEMTPGVAKFTMERSDASLIRNQAMKDGMTVLLEDGIRKIREGVTTIEEVLAVATLDQMIDE
ncbi:MAG: General secretion pathway protein F [candidate division TM6 bacterium GW2011_GWF2_30_66]|jgi:general secretion pathway protein E|nr:MAG: General secretion pathway protein F [candidate division TM6 bacterium GW2011_GWF2_30_66]